MTHPSVTISHPKLTQLRELLATLPEAVEIETWGHPTFRAGKKMFSAFGSKDGRATMTVKATLDQQADALDDGGAAYFVPAYVGHNGWIGLFVDEVPSETIEGLFIRAYRQQALKRMIKALDGELGK